MFQGHTNWAAVRRALKASLNSPRSLTSANSRGSEAEAGTLDALALQLFMLNNFSEILTEAGLPSSIQPLLVMKPPRPTAVRS